MQLDAGLSCSRVNVLSVEGQASVNKKTELSCDNKRVRACYRQEDRKTEEED